MTNSKTCTKCGETKAITEFNKHKGKKDGLYSSCKCCAKAANAAWDNANKAHKAAPCAAWYTANKAHKDAKSAAWKKANPELRAALLGKSNAVVRSHGCIPEGFDLAATVLIYAERNRLTKETGVQHHVDHIVSLANGGKHEASNLQVLTAAANRAKG